MEESGKRKTIKADLIYKSTHVHADEGAGALGLYRLFKVSHGSALETNSVDSRLVTKYGTWV
jgi:hypothetical protein